MRRPIDPFRFLATMLAVWANQREQDALERNDCGSRLFYSRSLDILGISSLSGVLRDRTRHPKNSFGGIHKHPDGAWMEQLGRNLADAHDGVLRGHTYFVHDRDPLFTRHFQETLASAGVKTARLPPRSPNLNAHAERFVRTIKESCLDRIIIFVEQGLRNAIREFVSHYHFERNHQGLGNRLILSSAKSNARGAFRRRERLGGLLNYYYREAA